jgi:type II secretory pathway component PulF
MALELTAPKKKDQGQPKFSLERMKSSALGLSKISSKDRIFFTEQLALMLETGTNLHVALQGIQTQVKNKVLLKIVDDLLSDISGGRTFSFALSRHPGVFSTTYVNLVAASEQGGFMHEVLNELVRMEDKREELRGSIVAAISYPATLLTLSLLVVIFVLVVVFPKFEEMFRSIQDQLPSTTVVFMAVSDIIRHHWIWLAVIFSVFIALLKVWANSLAGRKQIDTIKLTTPGLRDLFAKLYLLQTLRVMSLSLSHGVSVIDTLKSCREVVGNGLFKQFIRDVEKSVQEGTGISPGFEKSKFIPFTVKQMVATGEQTGSLPKVLGSLADFYEREMGKRLQALTKLAEPVMLLFMGVVVGLLVSSLILPIFKLSTAVG